jgi:hypothetical protein
MTASTSPSLFAPLLLPLQSLVDFFSPPVQASASSSKLIGMQPRLAKAPALPKTARSPNRVSIQPAGIRLVGQGLMGQMPDHSGAAQILRSRRAQDGRIVISGRMRDVCAELDRLCDEPA